MNMKRLVLGFVSGLVLTACGGPGPEQAPAAEELTTSQSALCEGWDSGARRCSWKCTSEAAQWSSVSAGVVAAGQCQQFASTRCATSAYASCWSR